MNHIEKGNGFPLILLHGNGEDLNYFKYQIDAFSEFYRVIAVDTRGHGKSDRGSAPFTISQFADDLYWFMQDKEIEKANLLGFSDGGNIALVFSMRYPEKVEKLILNGANLNGKGVKSRIQIPIIFGCKIAEFFSAKSPSAKASAEMLRLMVDDPNIAPEKLNSITSETLVIVGSRDMIKIKHTEIIYRNLPHAVLAVIKGNHFIARKKPTEFNAAVLEFLNKKHYKSGDRR